MKRFFFFVVVALGVIATTLTSCDKGEEDYSSTESKVVIPEVIHDTVVSTVVDTIEVITHDTLFPLSLIHWYDVSVITEHYVKIGKNFQALSDYERYAEKRGGVVLHNYLLWIGFASSKDYERFLTYTVAGDDRYESFSNRDQLIEFEQSVVTPARKYIANLKTLGYGGGDYTTWMEPEDFLEGALSEYEGKDPYAFAVFICEAARHAYLYGI